MEDGIRKCNFLISNTSILPQKNGLIQISSMKFQDGTIAESLLKPFQHGNSSSLEENKLNTMKEVPELSVNMSTQVVSWILEQ